LQARAETVPSAVVIVDPRSPERFRAGHIPGAINLPLASVDPSGPRRPELVGRSEIIVYGDDPASPVARAMVKRLMEAGFRNVRFFAGGAREFGELYGLATVESPDAP